MTTAADETPGSPYLRLVRIGLLAALYLVFGQLSLLPLVRDVIVTPSVFYSAGIALAFALHYGAWVWPGVFLGQFALAIIQGLPMLPSLGIAASNGAQVCLSVWLFHMFRLDPRLERARDLAGLQLLIVFVLQAFGGTLAHATLWLAGIIDTPLGLALSWRDWWLSGVLGQMLVTPMLLSLFAGHRTRSQAAGDVLFAVATLTPAMAAAEYLWFRTGMTSIIVILSPVFIWIAVRRGLIGVCAGGIFVAAVALFVTGHGWGPFVSGGAASIVDLNIYLGGITIGKQFIAVFLRQLAQRRETEERLRKQEEHLRIALIAREKALEAQHRRDLESKLKSSLAAAAVAHEIAQPLSTILLQSNMAIHDGHDARSALSVVAGEAKRVVTTIDKMKTLLRNVQTDHQPVDLAQVVRSTLLSSTALLDHHDVVVTQHGLDRRYDILGDDAQLILAIGNILRNSVEAIATGRTGHGRREIAIDLSGSIDEVVLTIGDSGPGWTGMEHTSTPLTTTKTTGTGVGLFVVQTAVQNHRASISFGRSALGGAEVKLAFPRMVTAAV